MNKRGKFFVFVAVLLFAAALLNACEYKEITISFDSNGGSEVASIVEKGNSVILIPENPTKAGCIFKGWYFDNDTFEIPFYNNSLTEDPKKSSFILYAKWEPTAPQPIVTHTVTAYLNEINLAESTMVKIDCEDGESISPIVLPDVEEYSFAGWFFDNQTFTQSAEDSLSEAIRSDMTVYAKWEINTYPIVFLPNGGTLISGEETQNVEYGGTAAAPVYEKEGFTLSWDRAFDNIASTITVEAIWTIKTYAVTFRGEGGLLLDGEATQTVEHDSAAVAPVYEKEGYTLSWDRSFNDITAQLTVTALWAINNYIVTFVGNGGTLISGEETQTVSYGGTANAPEYINGNYHLYWEQSFDTVTSDLVITAAWVAQGKHQFIFDGNGGELVHGDAIQYLSEGEQATEPLFQKQGYRFIGWSKDFFDASSDVRTAAQWGLEDVSKYFTYTYSYGYQFLAGMDNGTNLQSLYDDMLALAAGIHTNGITYYPASSCIFEFNVSDYELSMDEAITVWKFFLLDNPVFYWISQTIDVCGECLQMQMNESYRWAIFRQVLNAQMENTLAEYAEETAGLESELQIMLAIHDKMIGDINYAYEDDGITPQDDLWAHNIMGVFQKTGAVCQGYANAFYLLMNYFGIECISVSGYVGGVSHMWNIVRLDGAWY